MKKIFVLVFILLAPILFFKNNQNLFAQKHGQALIDSLLINLSKSKPDSTKVKLLNDICFGYYSINPEEGIKYGDMALELAKKINYKSGEARANSCIGTCYYSKSEYQKVLEFYKKSLFIYEEVNDNNGKAKVLGNIGNVYRRQSKNASALEFYFNALKLYELVNDKSGEAAMYGNIGIVYQTKEDYKKALEFYLKALESNKILNEKFDIAINLGNISTAYSELKNNKKALEYIEQALALNIELGYKRGIARSYSQIGKIKFSDKDYLLANQYFFKALQLSNETDDKRGIAFHQGNIGNCYLKIANDTAKLGLLKIFNGSKLKALLEARKYLDSSIAIGEEIGDNENLLSGYSSISSVEEALGNNQNALKYLKKFSATKDSVFNEINNKKITELEEARISDVNKKQLEIRDLALMKRKHESWFYIIVIVFLVGIIALVMIVFIQKNKANKKIKIAYQNLQIAQVQLLQAEKMASLGQITVGVANEINNPVNFITTSISSIKRDIVELKQLIKMYENNDENVANFSKRIDTNYLLIEIDELINGITEGAARTTEIVKGLYNFSTLNIDEKKPININDCLNATVMILQLKLKEKNIQLITKFSQLPDINCYSTEINQVFMSLISNSANLINSDNGWIKIETALIENYVEILISDNGMGINSFNQNSFLDPLFKSDKMEDEIHIGLKLVYQIIANNNGKIQIDTELTKGTIYKIQLPI